MPPVDVGNSIHLRCRISHTFTEWFHNSTNDRISIAPPQVEGDRIRAIYGASGNPDSIRIAVDADRSSYNPGSVVKKSQIF
jgi:hypothetical protein